MTTPTLQATCAPKQHQSLCLAGHDSCACVCHGPVLEQHVARWFHNGARYGLGYGVWCSCGFFAWQSTPGEAAAAWGAHALEAS